MQAGLQHIYCERQKRVLPREQGNVLAAYLRYLESITVRKLTAAFLGTGCSSCRMCVQVLTSNLLQFKSIPMWRLIAAPLGT
jgi:hypothetical protein